MTAVPNGMLPPSALSLRHDLERNNAHLALTPEAMDVVCCTVKDVNELCLVLQNMALSDIKDMVFGGRISLDEVIKLRQVYTGLESALSPPLGYGSAAPFTPVSAASSASTPSAATSDGFFNFGLGSPAKRSSSSSSAASTSSMGPPPGLESHQSRFSVPSSHGSQSVFSSPTYGHTPANTPAHMSHSMPNSFEQWARATPPEGGGSSLGVSPAEPASFFTSSDHSPVYRPQQQQQQQQQPQQHPPPQQQPPKQHNPYSYSNAAPRSAYSAGDYQQQHQQRPPRQPRQSSLQASAFVFHPEQPPVPQTQPHHYQAPQQQPQQRSYMYPRDANPQPQLQQHYQQYYAGSAADNVSEPSYESALAADDVHEMPPRSVSASAGYQRGPSFAASIASSVLDESLMGVPSPQLRHSKSAHSHDFMPMLSGTAADLSRSLSHGGAQFQPAHAMHAHHVDPSQFSPAMHYAQHGSRHASTGSATSHDSEADARAEVDDLDDVQQSGSPRLKMDRVFMFLNNSNIWIQGKKAAANWGRLDTEQDRRLRIDVYRLTVKVLAGRKLAQCNIYGSEPPRANEVQRVFKKSGWQLALKTRQRNSSGSSSGSNKSEGGGGGSHQHDRRVESHIARDISQLLDRNELGPEDGLIILTGDADIAPALEQVLLRSAASVEVYCWRGALSHAVQQVVRAHPTRAHCRYLDQIRHADFAYTEYFFNTDRHTMRPDCTVFLRLPMSRAEMHEGPEHRKHLHQLLDSLQPRLAYQYQWYCTAHCQWAKRVCCDGAQLMAVTFAPPPIDTRQGGSRSQQRQHQHQGQHHHFAGRNGGAEEQAISHRRLQRVLAAFYTTMDGFADVLSWDEVMFGDPTSVPRPSDAEKAAQAVAAEEQARAQAAQQFGMQAGHAAYAQAFGGGSGMGTRSLSTGSDDSGTLSLSPQQQAAGVIDNWSAAVSAQRRAGPRAGSRGLVRSSSRSSSVTSNDSSNGEHLDSQPASGPSMSIPPIKHSDRTHSTSSTSPRSRFNNAGGQGSHSVEGAASSEAEDVTAKGKSFEIVVDKKKQRRERRRRERSTDGRPANGARDLPFEAPPGKPDNWKTEMCRHFERGHCHFNTRCNFAHGSADGRCRLCKSRGLHLESECTFQGEADGGADAAVEGAPKQKQKHKQQQPHQPQQSQQQSQRHGKDAAKDSQRRGGGGGKRGRGKPRRKSSRNGSTNGGDNKKTHQSGRGKGGRNRQKRAGRA